MDKRNTFERPILRRDPVADAALHWEEGQETHRGDLSAYGFLRLLKTLRPVLLQDSALLISKFPNHPMFRHVLFQRPDYHDFAVRVRAAQDQNLRPRHVELQEAMPYLEAEVRHNQMETRQRFGEVIDSTAETNARIDQLNTRMGNLDEAVHQVGSDVKGIARALRNTAYDDLEIVTTLRRRQPNVEGQQEELDGPNPTASTAAPIHPQPQPPQPEPLQPRQPLVSDQHRHPDMPQYRLSRAAVTAYDLWKELAEGFGGGPSVRTLEEQFGSNWRTNPTERVFFCRRRPFWEEVQRMVHQGAPEEAAVTHLEEMRRDNRWSLNQLCAHLKQ